MQKLVTTFSPGERIEVLMGDNPDTDWRKATIHRCFKPGLYQVNIPGVGFIIKNKYEIRKDPDHDDAETRG
jgi:hypothetical protein